MYSWLMPRRLIGTMCVMWLGLIAQSVRGDTYTITLDPEARSEPATGRVVLFFITQKGRQWDVRRPIDGPFFEAPQPIASVAVENLKPGESVTIDGHTPAFPDSLDKLAGSVRVQAILDADQTERSHTDGPGNVHSDVLAVEVSANRNDAVQITLKHRIEGPKQHPDQPHLKWIRFRSQMLSEFYGRDVYHRAGVALPRHYHDPNWHRQQWPAVYVIPGYGGRDEGAIEYMEMLQAPLEMIKAPVGVFIVLDPESPLGHHGFCDSANNGPRGAALVKELIPHLEKEFRLVAKPEARLVTGHSSGGWSSLWLQLNYPDVFGGCWASAPDPVDFTAFQMTDLYTDTNMYVDGQGKETPSFQHYVDATFEPKPLMTVRQEVAMELAIDPTWRSGQQWAAWTAMFSPRDPESGLPVPMFDPSTGDINKRLVRIWSRYDISHVTYSRWDRWGPVLRQRVRLICGDRDSFYLHRAVQAFKQRVDTISKEFPHEGEGYIKIIADADHNSVVEKTFVERNEEIYEHFVKHGLQDEVIEQPPPKVKEALEQ